MTIDIKKEPFTVDNFSSRPIYKILLVQILFEKYEDNF